LKPNPVAATTYYRKAGMYAVVRTYSGQGASELFDLLGQREEDVKALISGVPGFVNYVAVRSGDCGVTVTVCDDKAGTDESSRRAAEWVKDNLSATADPPTITEGDTVLQFGSEEQTPWRRAPEARARPTRGSSPSSGHS
jgi:hypothetical protein